MANKPSSALQVLSQNLDRLMQGSKEYNAQAAVARKAKVDQKTISRIIHKTNEPSLDKLERIAAVFGLQPWQMLVPGLQPEVPPQLAEQRDVEAVT